MFRRKLFGLYWVLFGLLFTAVVHGSDESVCAEVKIEIAQELTMERQAFEATMRITNTLDGVDLEDMEDENGDPVVVTSDTTHDSADFFVRLDDSRGVDHIATA